VNTTLSGGAISSYYRFPFQADFSPVGATFSLRQIIDDGVVTYFNGAEIYRSNMPTGAVNALTPASQDRPAFDTGAIALPDVFARFGTNVLAAELHGASTSDQNLAFGAELSAQILSWARGPVLITSGPDDVTVEEGGSALFRFVGVGASGFQWQTNGISLPGANLPVLRVDAVPLLWDGLFVRVLASNDTSMAISANARLHVLADHTPPSLLGAVAQSNGILLTFSEPLLAQSATNLSNYSVSNGMGMSVNLQSVTMVSPSKVLLIAGSPQGGGYEVVVNGVRDAATAQNEIAPNTRASVGFDFFIPIDAVWKYNTNGANLGTAWRMIGFDDTTPDWPSGAGLIAEEDCGCLPEPIRTPISRLVNGFYHYTFYFRYHWYLPLAPASASITLRHIIDDGAIMYINGQEFHRFNMPSGPVDYTTQASTNVGNAIYFGPVSATFTNLIAGDNVIAVEVHQNGTASSDVTFGVEFVGNVASLVVPGDMPAQLQITRQDGNIVVSWTGSGVVLEASDVLGPAANWQPVDNQSNPYFTSASASTQRFYRLSR
jgi:hypothetical protein